jgi:hypothetical protein
MMDYYGSIPKTDFAVAESLVQNLSEYPEDYVVEMSKKLGVYDTTYSVSGWSVFHGPEWVKKIRNILIKETEDAKKNLAIVKIAVGTPDFPKDMEISKQIASHLTLV